MIRWWKRENWLRLLEVGQLPLLALVLAVSVFAFIQRRAPSQKGAIPAGNAPTALQRQHPRLPGAELFQMISTADRGDGDHVGNLQQYRLAGTFFAYDENAVGSVSGVRQAIIDNPRDSAQVMVREGEAFHEYVVKSIQHDRVILAANGNEFELLLGFRATPGSPAADTNAPLAVAVKAADPSDSSKYGRKLGENRWMMNKDALNAYYEEMKADPERLALLYLSFKPRYEGRKITGYNLDIEGEGEFLKAAGLRQKDVVKAVNSTPMTSQRHAEYFISEFAKNRLGAVVLDIERDGKPQKMIYMFR